MLDGLPGVLRSVHDVEELQTVQQTAIRGVGVEIVDENSVLQLETHRLHRVVDDGNFAKISAENFQVFDVPTLVEETLTAEQSVGDEALLRVDPVNDSVAVQTGGGREHDYLEQASSLSEELSEEGPSLLIRNLPWRNI